MDESKKLNQVPAKSYNSPTITKFGKVRHLTTGASGPGNESTMHPTKTPKP